MVSLSNYIIVIFHYIYTLSGESGAIFRGSVLNSENLIKEEMVKNKYNVE